MCAVGSTKFGEEGDGRVFTFAGSVYEFVHCALHAEIGVFALVVEAYRDPKCSRFQEE